MRTEITGDLAMLDRRTMAQIGAAPGRIFERLATRVAKLDLKVSHLTRTGATLCEVTVKMADKMQVMARHRDSDAARAAMQALESARSQVRRSIQRARRRRLATLAPANP